MTGRPGPLPRVAKGIVVVVALLALGGTAVAGERLVLVGGGDRPPEAMRRFVEWAGGPRSRVLVVLWATGEPRESLSALEGELRAAGAAEVEAAPLAPVEGEGRARTLSLVAAATGVFFSGGDQGRVMDVLEDRALLEAFRERYARGVVFGGTSAGTAVMSDPMITGEGDFTVIDGSQVGTRPGLGLLPGTIVDQHFVRRQRQNRLFGLVLAHPRLLGLGVDEDTVAFVRDNRHLEVAGRGAVLAVDGRKGRETLLVHVLRPGSRFDLRRRRRD